MNIEELTKSQIILLTLLVSFVTSIATGIVTVTLLDQAPPAVTQTINRVVERTVERVVPGETTGPVVTKETTVVVKENDLITESIEKNAQNIVRVHQKTSSPGGGETTTLVGLGIVISKGGLVATDSSIISSGTSYSVTTTKGETFNVRILENDASRPTAILAIETGGEAVSFSAVTFSELSSLKLGQTVIALGGEERINVSTGIISDLAVEEASDNNSPNRVTSIRAGVGRSTVLLGSPLIDIFGEVVGISTAVSQQLSGTTYTPIHVVAAQLGTLSALTNEN